MPHSGSSSCRRVLGALEFLGKDCTRVPCMSWRQAFGGPPSSSPPPSQGTCVLIRLASCHLASFSRALTGRKRCPGPDVTGGQPGPGLQLSGGGDRAVAGVGGGQEATRTWLFIQGTQQPQQSPFARPAEVPGKEQGPETERGWWMGCQKLRAESTAQGA